MDASLFLEKEPKQDHLLVRALLRIEGAAPADKARTPLNLCLVLDRSGSMSGRKLAAVRDAASMVVRRLAPEDTVGIVIYDDQVATLIEPAPGGDSYAMVARIRGIRSGGMTNLSGGWIRGSELVTSRLRPGAVNRVLLLTDGLANVGITDPGALRDLIGSAAATGVTTTTIGFGADYDEYLLAQIADAGGGNTYYIEHPDQAATVFATELEGLLAIAAQNVAVEIRPSPAVELAAVLHDYPGTAIDGGLRLELGDLYALEPRAVLSEFRVTAATDQPIDVATVTIAGYVLGADGTVERRTVTMPIRVSGEAIETADGEVRSELLKLRAARVRGQAIEDRGRGEYGLAARRLREVAADLHERAGDDPVLREEAEDLYRMAQRFEEGDVGPADLKYLHLRDVSLRKSNRRASDAISRTKDPKRKEP